MPPQITARGSRRCGTTGARRTGRLLNRMPLSFMVGFFQFMLLNIAEWSRGVRELASFALCRVHSMRLLVLTALLFAAFAAAQYTIPGNMAANAYKANIAAGKPKPAMIYKLSAKAQVNETLHLSSRLSSCSHPSRYGQMSLQR